MPPAARLAPALGVFLLASASAGPSAAADALTVARFTGPTLLHAPCVWWLGRERWQPLSAGPVAPSIAPGQPLPMPAADPVAEPPTQAVLLQAWTADGQPRWHGLGPRAPAIRWQVTRAPGGFDLTGPPGASPPQVWLPGAQDPPRFEPARHGRCPAPPAAVPLRAQSPGHWSLPAGPSVQALVLRDADGHVQHVAVMADGPGEPPLGLAAGPGGFALASLAALAVAAWRWRTPAAAHGA